MKTILALCLSMAIGSQAFAATCPKMKNKAMSKYQKASPVTSYSYAAFSNVMKHYRFEIAQYSEFKAYIESNAAYIKGGKVTGYDVVVSMRGDEDVVRYILNEKKEIIVAHWSNQSPMIYWFCGKDAFPEGEYSEEGLE